MVLSALNYTIIGGTTDDFRCVAAWLNAGEIPHSRIHHLPNFTDLLPRKSTPPFTQVIIYSGSLTDSTGKDFLASANTLFSRSIKIALIPKGHEIHGEAALKQGVHDYLIQKKFDSFELIKSIRQAYERATFEASVEESKLQLQAVLNHSGNSILLANDEGEYVDANKAAEEMCGYSIAELKTMKISQLVASDRNEILGQWQSFLKIRKDEGIITLLKKDGKKIVASYKAVANILPGIHMSILSDVTSEMLQRQQQDLITEIYKISSHVRNLDESLQAIMQTIRKSCGWKYSEIWWKDSKADNLYLIGNNHSELPPSFELFKSVSENLRYSASIDAPLIVKAYKSGQPLLINDIAKEEAFQRKTSIPANSQYMALLIPIIRENENKGLLFLFNEARQDLADDKEDFFELLSPVARVLGDEIEKIKDNYEMDQIISTSTDPIAVLSFQQNFLRANHAFETIFGYNHEEIRNLDMYDLVPPESRAHVSSLFEKCIKGESLAMEDVLTVSRSGKKIWIELSATPNLSTGSIYLIGRDVTNYKAAQEKLLRANRKFQLATKTTKMGIWELNINEDEVIFDEGVCNIYALPPSEARINRARWKEFLHPEDEKVVLEAFSKCIDGEKSLDLQYRIIANDGTEKYVKISAELVCDEEGKATTLIGLSLDISDYVRSEKEKTKALVNLRERIKEQKCLYNISRIQHEALSIEELLSRAVNLLPPAFQHPANTEACIHFRSETYASKDFKRTSLTLSATTEKVDGHPLRIEIACKEKINNPGKAVFLKEEALLIEAVADHLATAIDRILSKKKLQERENRFRNLIENNFDVILIQDKNYLLKYVTPSAERMIGYKPEELQGTNAASYVHPDDLKIIAPGMSKLLSGELKSVNYELRIRCRDNNYLWVYTTITNQFNVPGVNGIVFNFKNIDLEQKSRKELEQSEARLERTQKMARLGYWWFDLDSYELYWGKEVYELYGLNPEEFEMNFENFLKLVHPEDRHLFSPESFAQLEEEAAGEIEYRIVKSSGEVMWLRGMANILKAKQNPGKIIEGAVQDITDRKLAELRLEEREERFRNLIEHNYDVMLILSEDFKMQYVSPSCVRLTGHTPEEILGTTASIHVHPEDIENRNAAMEKLISGHESVVSFKERIQRKDGQYIWIHATVTDHRNLSGINGFVFNLKNIDAEETARKKLDLSQLQLKRAQDIANLGYFRFNIAESEVYWSKEVYEFFGLDPAVEMDFEMFISHIHPEDRHFFFAEAMYLEAGQMLDEIEYRVTKPTGETVWLRNKTHVESAENGKAKVLEGTVQNITDRKLTELKLEEREQRFRLFMENTPILSWLKDKEGRLLAANQKFLQVSGRTFEDFGKDPEEYTRTDLSPQTRINDLKVLKAGEAMHFTEEIKTSSGETRIFDVYKFPFFSDNELLMGGFALDITENKLHLDAIEKQNTKLREIAWMQSHIVRAPLATLMGLVSLFKEDELKEREKLEITRQIGIYAKELDQIIRDMIKASSEVDKTEIKHNVR